LSSRWKQQPNIGLARDSEKNHQGKVTIRKLAGRGVVERWSGSLPVATTAALLAALVTTALTAVAALA